MIVWLLESSTQGIDNPYNMNATEPALLAQAYLGVNGNRRFVKEACETYGMVASNIKEKSGDMQ